MASPLLEVEDLRTHYVGFGGRRVVKAVDGVSFTLSEGQTIGLVGESGCGKTTLCLSLVRLLAAGAKIESGSIKLNGREITTLTEKEMAHVRGNEIGMILQDPMTSLNPVLNIETQVAEPAKKHLGIRGKQLLELVQELLRSVRIPSPELRMAEYPHQMSGGHAATDRWCDRAVGQTGGDHRRRADDQPRRHDPSAVSRPAPQAPGRDRRRPDLRHPRSRDRGQRCATRSS